MKHFLTFLAFLVFLLSVSAVAYAKGKTTKETITSGDKTRTYYLFVPENISAGKPAPLILLLHGSNHDGLSLVDNWKNFAEKEGIFLVGPNSIESSRWTWGSDGPDFLHELVEALKARYPINPRRVYLFGHSAGASFALMMSLIESEYFAAMALHAGALTPEEYSLTDYAKRKIPMMIFVGDRDPFVPLSAVRGTRDSLVSRGFSIELNEMPNHDHWYYDLAPKINQSAWEFLRKQELAAEPRYEQYKSRK